MTGPEHYTEAERLLRGTTGPDGRRYSSTPSDISEAQVHATLALAASAPLADIVGILTEIRDEIARLPSSGRAS
jgi:hypothetical protein